MQTVSSIVNILTEHSLAMCVCVYSVCCPVHQEIQVVKPFAVCAFRFFFDSIKILQRPTFSAKWKLKKQKIILSDMFGSLILGLYLWPAEFHRTRDLFKWICRECIPSDLCIFFVCKLGIIFGLLFFLSWFIIYLHLFICYRQDLF